MVWRARAPLTLGKLLGRVNGGNHSFAAFKPVVCVPVLVNNLSQVRWKSGSTFTEIGEFVSPEVPVATIFSDLSPVLITQDWLYQLHDWSGLAWAPTIIATTFSLRLLMGVPLAVIQEKSLSRLLNLNPEFQKLGLNLAKEVKIAQKIYGWDEGKAKREFKKSFKTHRNKILEEHNCHPARTFCLPILQLPVWIFISSAIRNIACLLPTTSPDTAEQHYRYMQMAVENPGWVESLVVPDPFILPGLFILVNLINMQIHSASRVNVQKGKLQKVVPWCIRGVIVGTGLFAAYVPAAVSVYWVSSSAAALAINILLKVNIVRGVFRLPRHPSIKFRLPFLGKTKTA